MIYGKVCCPHCTKELDIKNPADIYKSLAFTPKHEFEGSECYGSSQVTKLLIDGKIRNERNS